MDEMCAQACILPERLQMQTADQNSSIGAVLRTIRDRKTVEPSERPDLRGAVLVAEDLSNMDLSGADLTGADLTGADLSNTTLFQATLIDVSLLNAKLDNADFTGADLTNANLEHAKGHCIGMGMATLTNTNFFHASFRNISLTKSTMRHANFQCANLQEARIREANLENADFTGADMRQCDLSMSRVKGTIFRDADMRSARLRAIKGYEQANWIGVDFRDINFAGAYCLRRFALDQNYLKEFRERSFICKIIYYLWLVTSDCGRSISRWCLWLILQIMLFSFLNSLVDIDYGSYPTFLSPIYFSVVTLTTLGYGDVVPMTWTAQIVAMAGVCAGYIMLGGLLSIFAVKMARRGE